jgi:hypothetical protein
MGGQAVQLDHQAELFVEHVVIRGLFPVDVPGLANSRWQAVCSFHLVQVSPFEDRVATCIDWARSAG